ncbi:MAG: hypothetical protein JWM64_919 [Frankiales bacterium]|nr:hypothetical protein [Frankiales bacterium]
MNDIGGSPVSLYLVSHPTRRHPMSLFTRSRSTRPSDGSSRRTRTRRAVSRALAVAPTVESRHELLAQSTRL